MLGVRTGFGMQPILMGKSGVDLSTRGATEDVDPRLAALAHCRWWAKWRLSKAARATCSSGPALMVQCHIKIHNLQSR